MSKLVVTIGHPVLDRDERIDLAASGEELRREIQAALLDEYRPHEVEVRLVSRSELDENEVVIDADDPVFDADEVAEIVDDVWDEENWVVYRSQMGPARALETKGDGNGESARE